MYITHVHCIPFSFIIVECSVIFFTSLRLEGQVSEITCQNGRALEIETSSRLQAEAAPRGREEKEREKIPQLARERVCDSGRRGGGGREGGRWRGRE